MDDADGVDLGLPSCRGIVAVSAAFAIVDDDHRSFKRHLGGSIGGAEYVMGKRSNELECEKNCPAK